MAGRAQKTRTRATAQERRAHRTPPRLPETVRLPGKDQHVPTERTLQGLDRQTRHWTGRLGDEFRTRAKLRQQIVELEGAYTLRDRVHLGGLGKSERAVGLENAREDLETSNTEVQTLKEKRDKFRGLGGYLIAVRALQGDQTHRVVQRRTLDLASMGRYLEQVAPIVESAAKAGKLEAGRELAQMLGALANTQVSLQEAVTTHVASSPLDPCLHTPAQDELLHPQRWIPVLQLTGQRTVRNAELLQSASDAIRELRELIEPAKAEADRHWRLYLHDVRMDVRL